MEEPKDRSFMTLLLTLDSQPSDFLWCDIMNCLYYLSHCYSCFWVFVAKNIPVTFLRFFFFLLQRLTHYSVDCILHLIYLSDLFISTYRSASFFLFTSILYSITINILQFIAHWLKFRVLPIFASSEQSCNEHLEHMYWTLLSVYLEVKLLTVELLDQMLCQL